VPVVLGLLLLLAGVLWFLPSGELVQNTPDDLETVMDKTLAYNLRDYNLFYRINILIQSALILAATFATVFAAITTKDNTEKVKKYSVFLTAVTAGLAAVLSTFHIRDNMDTLIGVTQDLQVLEIKYLAARAKVIEDIKKKDPNFTLKKVENSAALPRELLELQREWLPLYTDILRLRMRAWSNIGSQTMQANDALPKKP
jgi:hypothetical protein